MRSAVILLTVALGSGAVLWASDADKPLKPKVKLAVLVVFDQMRGDFPDRWGDHFGETGFKRLGSQGAHFPDCHYPYAGTSTGPGHASMLAGCSPWKHGVIENTWYNRAAGASQYCAGSTRYELVPPLYSAAELAKLDPKNRPKPTGVGCPEPMVGPTLADVLKANTAGKGKVFGLSLKDRAAVLPAGRQPDGVYWFDGRFGTSTYYRDSLPGWVSAFNSSGKAESYFGKDWTRFRDDLDYTAIVGPDDAPGEGTGKDQGIAFPHPTTGGKPKLGKAYYEAMVNSPAGNDLLFAFLRACVIEEKLGQDDVPDLLTVSFSSNDLIGHTWGPDSHEVFDVTLRSDALMSEMLAFLDRQVGAGNYTIVVTADHGIAPLPKADQRLNPLSALAGAEKHLREAFGPVVAAVEVAPTAKPGEANPPADAPKKVRNLWLESVEGGEFYLNRNQVKAVGQTVEVVAAKLAEYLRTQPGIARAYTAQDLVAESKAGDEFFLPTKRSFQLARSGDVVVVTKPGVQYGKYTTGTSHGTPHEYDTHSVFYAYGPGIAPGRRTEKITPLHACAILADALGVSPPANAEYGLPATLAEAGAVALPAAPR